MPHVGIRCTYDDFDLRRELLLFDRLALPHFDITVRQWHESPNELLKMQATSLEWLADRDVIFVPSLTTLEDGPAAADYHAYLHAEEVLDTDLQLLRHWLAERSSSMPVPADEIAALMTYARETGDFEIFSRLVTRSRWGHDCLARALAAKLNSTGEAVALPIVSSNSYHGRGGDLTRSDVLTIAFKAIPFPAIDTPLESILDFRSDPEVRTDFLALHRWATEVARLSKSPAEIREEIDYLIAQYTRHMKIHRIEQGQGIFETVITVAAEALEDLVKIKWHDAAKLLFSFQKWRASLLKAEDAAPGRELAYLVKVSESARF